MKLVISMDLDNAAFEDGGADEVGRILASIAERIPDPLTLTNGALSLHDINGNHCGSAEVVNGEGSDYDALQEIHRLVRNAEVPADARNWIAAVRAVACKAIGA